MNRVGVAYAPSSQATASSLSYLPLREVHVKALIVDVSARVTLRQTYYNTQDTATSRCKYVFPVPADAAICAFSMSTSDGRTINGVCKEKQAALQDYEQGVREGHLAGLVNYVTDDIFTISIGAVPAQGTVEIYLEYVMTLLNDDSIDQVRFQLLQGVGERYGEAPAQLETASKPSSHTKVKITCDIQMSGRIKEVTSPSHGDEAKETRYPVSGGRSSQRRTTVRLRLPEYLDRDFVLIIRASRLDAPRCFVEVQKNAEQGHHSLAFQLSLVPKEVLPPISTQEYLFVVDRSGSMHNRISTAKDTLLLLLRMLPTKGSFFNVFTFNDEVTSLWRNSQEYNEATLLQASKFVNSIQAEGGTKMGGAFRFILQRRKRDMPTAAFVFTDGEVYSDEPIQVVSEAVQRSPEHCPLRVFTLGIGSGISTAICDGVARAGNGVSLYALDTESILGKCVRLLMAGRSPSVRDVTIDWGLSNEDSETPTVKFLSQTLSPRTVATTLPPTIQQAPTEVNCIHAGTRMSVYAIILVKKIAVPRKIVLTGQLNKDSAIFKLPITIDEVRIVGTGESMPLVHTLAAWHLIQEHEGRRAPLPQPLLPATDDELRKAVIVRLGEKYQLASQHTAFVAVDSGQDDTRSRRPPIPDGQISVSHPAGRLGFFEPILGLISDIFGYRLDACLSGGQQMPGSWWDSPKPADVAEGNYDDGAESDDSEKTFSTLSSLESCNWNDWSEPASPVLGPQPTSEEEHRQSLPSPKIVLKFLDSDAERTTRRPRRLADQARNPGVPSEVVALLKLQLHDGSYQLNDSLQTFVGAKAMGEVWNWKVADKVWATALSISFIRKMGRDGQEEMLSDLVKKAMEYLSSATDVDVEEIIQRATEILG